MNLSRRDLLKTGALATTGALLPRTFQSVFASPGAPATTKSLIILWMAGGPATIDLWDPKPGRPNGGPQQGIDTPVPTIQLSHFLPKTAARMKDFALIRSMKTDQADHARGHYLLHTGY